MYGVPADLPLNRFVGKTIDGIMINQFQLSLYLEGLGSIAIQGGWELSDPTGLVVDLGQDHGERDCYRIHRIIGIPIARFAINPPRSLTLIFESGHSLEILDYDEHYESFQIYFGGMGSFII